MKQLCALLLFCCTLLPAWAQPRLLDPADAFRPSLTQIDSRTLEARFEIAPGHYLYRDRFAVATKGLKPTLPGGQFKQDPAFGRVETYSQQVAIRLVASRDWPADEAVTLRYQGCAEAGICYPPQTVTLRPGESTAKGRPDSLSALLGPAAQARETDLPLSPPQPALFSGSFAGTLGLFFLAGLGLAFTACMYPLIPIVSGIVLGGAPGGRGRAFGLAFTYVQGMALSYTVAGLLAAASGAYLAVLLQQPWVIGGFALFFVAMALAMFGIFDLQLPSRAQSRFNAWANRLPGGRFVPVFAMGALSALIVGPCMAPPLAAALAYLGQSGDLLLGGTALYALALGTGLPLIVIGLFGATALPRVSPRVLAGIKAGFGILLLGMAVWIARPLWQSRIELAGQPFRPVQSVAGLERTLPALRGQPVMLDFSADWCVSCLEFERETLADPAVQAKLRGFALLRADVTDNTPEQRELMQRYQVFGPPTLLFFDREGRLRQRRVTGVAAAEEFLAILDEARN